MQHPGFLYFAMLLDASARPVPYADEDAPPDVAAPPDVVGPARSPGAGGGIGPRVTRSRDARPASGRLRTVAWLGDVRSLVTGLGARVRSG